MQPDVPYLEWGVASRAHTGESLSGDQSIVHPTPLGVLLGVIDALGHGREAANTAARAIAALRRYAHEPLPATILRCHGELLGTRGAVMSLAFLNPSECTLTSVGIGNVEAVLVSGDPVPKPAQTALLSRAGIVGGELAKLIPQVVPLKPGDTLLLSTDGIRPGFAAGMSMSRQPQEIADAVLGRGAKGTDDALVLVARYTGARS